MALYKLDQNLKATQLHPLKIPKEREIQRLCEKNLDTILGVRFLASEYSTGKSHAGRIDTLGLDQNGCPVIIEYKKTQSESVILQGLYYLQWLSDHHADFEALVSKVLGDDTAVDWSSPRVVLIAESFTKFDNHAISTIDQRIELKSYRWYESGLFLLEESHGKAGSVGLEAKPMKAGHPTLKPTYDFEHHLGGKSDAIRKAFNDLRDNILGLAGTDMIREQVVKKYVAYKTTKNFCEVEVQVSKVKVYIDINLKDLRDPKKWAEDCSKVGHWATGNSRFVFPPGEDLAYAMDLIQQAHRINS